MVLLRQLSYAIKTQLKAPKAPDQGHFLFFSDQELTSLNLYVQSGLAREGEVGPGEVLEPLLCPESCRLTESD